MPSKFSMMLTPECSKCFPDKTFLLISAWSVWGGNAYTLNDFIDLCHVLLVRQGKCKFSYSDLNKEVTLLCIKSEALCVQICDLLCIWFSLPYSRSNRPTCRRSTRDIFCGTIRPHTGWHFRRDFRRQLRKKRRFVHTAFEMCKTNRKNSFGNRAN